jgi:hypothetical protein
LALSLKLLYYSPSNLRRVKAEHLKFVSKCKEPSRRERLSECISNLISARDMTNRELLGNDLFANKVDIQLEMLSAGMQDRIMSNKNSTDIVA